MSDNQPPAALTDAERIRLKRLAKLQGAASASSSSGPSTPAASSGGATPASSTPAGPSPKATPSPSVASPAPKPKAPTPVAKPIATPGPPAQSPVPAVKKKPATPPKLDLPTWEHEVLQNVLKVTLSKGEAEKSGHDLVWLKSLSEDLASDGGTDRLSLDLLDQLLIARLELDPQTMSDDLEYLPVLVSLPAGQTVFEYLVGSWKRLNAARTALTRRGYPPVDTQNALTKLEKIRELIISYAGFTLQEPEMFPQPSGRELGPPELIKPLLSLSALSAPLMGSSTPDPNTLGPSDIDQFLRDLATRFEPDNEIDSVLAPVIRGLLFHESLFRLEGLGGGDAGWRGVVGGLELLVSIKPIAIMITRMEEWIPENATAFNFETLSLMGPLCRLGIFSREWPAIATTYFSDPDKRSRADIESSFASLRGTLKSLQSSLFQIFNLLVRASPESRERTLQYFARVIALNGKRAGMQVDPGTVASDSFMLNMQAILMRFAEPFMDANYSKMDRIDPLFYAHCDRIVLGDETRIKATTEEANEFMEQHKKTDSPPNFISNIFFLTVAMAHYGFLKTIDTYNNTHKQMEDIQRHLQMLEGDGSWMGTPMQARVQATIKLVKTEEAKIKMQQLAFQAALTDPDLVFHSLGFTNFLSTWVIRQADPTQKHPSPTVQLPLPKEVPMVFRTLPEYFIEDVVDYLFFAVQNTPDKFEIAGKNELLIFILTFLTSTWYIKNPFLKSKINDVLFMSTWGYGRERNGVLGNMLNSHPLALKHLIPALTHFYIEVEQTGASSQFYDKFNARRNIAFVLKIIWNNPVHREALSIEAKNVDKFIRFVNLMINDVTYLMDESLGELAQIHNIQQEMDDREGWNSRPLEYRREREGTLRSLERHAAGYTTLGRSTVEMLKVFTAETKPPFMMPEIVDKLAAMLDYNLAALAGPRCQDLVVREPEKLKFNPKALLSDILQVYINLSDQPEFARAVAGDGRSYSRELFERAANLAVRRSIKSSSEIEVFRAFIEKVEAAKATLEAEEDLGEVPEEFLDPLMFTVMRDPVRLPSSKTVIDRATIKSHLLSDSKDPFNRAPLAIEDVIPEPELKAKIEAFIEARRAEREAAKMDVDK
ncbi:ubiquitin conjugation factor E4 [Coprinopsis cinerea okayama7|uniref:RING-type E3 ubiquitin transferase n=1 Tax=Coprinopsis cinerea (strain Okayama-7 / 130 / ATCC MYA-4618 / FGSC 9003) TaxID=240176 RepID=A8NR84_COPC7|nr:ubiquitin conjugation factor E4 [Coprinopsis cinerea okayama7\|eukprot:XP_001835722.1 ubiquitin conjugation factor E4 [Coprinopsis cinerea okayama7\